MINYPIIQGALSPGLGFTSHRCAADDDGSPIGIPFQRVLACVSGGVRYRLTSGKRSQSYDREFPGSAAWATTDQTELIPQVSVHQSDSTQSDIGPARILAWDRAVSATR